MKHSLAAVAVLIPSLLVATLAGCSTGEPAEPAKEKETSKSAPAETETLNTVTGLPLLDGVAAGVPEGWATFDEGNLTYAVASGMDPDLDTAEHGDAHHQLEPWFTGTPNEAGETILGSEYVQVQQVEAGDEYEVTDGYEVTIPGGYVVVTFREHEFPEAGVVTTTGQASVHSTDGAQHYYTFWDFGPADAGIPKMKQYLGSLSIN